MSFAKPETKQSSQDDYSRLLCTFPGCNAVWTVQIDRPMCSFHQWKGEPPQKKNIAAKPVKETKTAAQWYQNEDKF